MPPTPWTDATVMPWGEHKGKRLGELPASYLLWLFEQTWIRDWPGLHLYLKAHESQLMAEKKEDGGLDGDEEGFRSYDDYKNYRN
jgi:hypothetical protein